MEKKLNFKYLVPVLMSYFVMSFIDLVGIGVDRVKPDFQLSDTLAQLIPMVAFLWFFVLSVPVGILQDHIGKRKMLNIGMAITALGLLVPFFFYTFATVLVGFALIGIGNTVVQVSANPLLVDVVPSNRTSSFLSFSQFIKAIGSMAAAPLAGWLALQYGDWKLLFLVFGIVSILTVLWLATIKIDETTNSEKKASFASSFRLLFKNGFVSMMVLCIFLIVGIDVGVNSVSGQFLLNKFHTSQTFAESGRSVYFFGKMLGTFGGALLLAVLSARKFFLWSAILSLVSILALIAMPSAMSAMVVIFIIGLGVANIFPLVFSLSVEKYPERSNEISGLMIMAVSGGAVIPFLTGWLTDNTSATIGLFVLVACAVYELGAAFYNLKKR